MPGVGGWFFTAFRRRGRRATGPCVAGIGRAGRRVPDPLRGAASEGRGLRATGAGRRAGGRPVAYGGRAPAGPRPLRVPPSQRESAAKATR